MDLTCSILACLAEAGFQYRFNTRLKNQGCMITLHHSDLIEIKHTSKPPLWDRWHSSTWTQVFTGYTELMTQSNLSESAHHDAVLPGTLIQWVNKPDEWLKTVKRNVNHWWAHAVEENEDLHCQNHQSTMSVRPSPKNKFNRFLQKTHF